MKRIAFVLFLVLSLVGALPAWAQNPHCKKVGGVLMTNIGAIDGTYNLGPVFGDLAGSVGAKFLTYDGNGKGTVQHYWVTASGETIKFAVAELNGVPISEDKLIVAVPWGSYESDIVPGGTGKYENAHGKVWYFGMADLHPNKLTLVLRYRGEVCFEGGEEEQ